MSKASDQSCSRREKKKVDGEESSERLRIFWNPSRDTKPLSKRF